ncbi:Eys [Columba livia]|nr:Eys [Columba livia]
MTAEWRVEPKPTVIKWTLRENICSDFYTECWNVNKTITGGISEEQNLIIPQICPLQLQLGDSLFISSEPSFQSYGMNLVNISREEFINCPKTDVLQEQMIFVCQIRGLHQVDPNWLGVGTHYFAELHKRGPLLCNMGLRLNITVKQQFCQQSPNAPLCSGHGKCLSHVWEKAYNCHCFSQYSGRFCQKFDMCSTKPCHNNASCTEKSELSGDSYECTCPPQFSGKNCTEIVGQCQSHTCFNGNCSNVSPNTFLCECDKDFAGPFCEEPGDPCASHPCVNGGICQYKQSGYVCDCPTGFLGHNCEIDINECSSMPCQNRGKFCEVQIENCDSNSCKNGGTCVDYEDHFKCNCPIGFEGERCELDIDACLFYNISCAPGGLCVDKSHGFNYTCLSPCIGKKEVCGNGGSCFYNEENQTSHCVCALGWTGQTCLENINDCESGFFSPVYSDEVLHLSKPWESSPRNIDNY